MAHGTWNPPVLCDDPDRTVRCGPGVAPGTILVAKRHGESRHHPGLSASAPCYNDKQCYQLAGLLPPPSLVDKERQSEPAVAWILARRFPDPPRARAAYEAARDLLLDEDLDASVFRMTLSGVSFVAVVGIAPPREDATQRMEDALAAGEPAELPEEILQHLRERRHAFKGLPIEYLERRSQEAITCLECKRNNVLYYEDVPAARGILRREGEKVIVDGLIRDIDFESPDNPRFFCTDCGHEWPVGDTRIEFQ